MKKSYGYWMGLMIWVIGVSGLTSCSVDPNVVTDQFVAQEDKIWSWKEVQSYDFEVGPGDYYYNVSIQLRITGQFAYSNLWMVYRLGWQDSIKTSKLTELSSKSSGAKQFQGILADETGRWLGEGKGNLRVYSFPVMQRVILKPGKYRFLLRQNVRVDELFGVSDVGIKVEKAGLIL